MLEVQPDGGVQSVGKTLQRGGERGQEILIRRALLKTKGNRTRAAEILEISHRALLYKIKDYNILDL